MHHDALSLVLELICKSCASKDCKNHQEQVMCKDIITGLEIETKCICNKHGDKYAKK